MIGRRATHLHADIQYLVTFIDEQVTGENAYILEEKKEKKMLDLSLESTFSILPFYIS